MSSNNNIIPAIKNRLNLFNKNWLCLICGEPGSGKSYSALAIAEKVYPDFTIENVMFTPKQFLEKLNNPKLAHKGAMFVFDEAGVGMASRDWYSVQNKLLGAVLQIFRSMNVGVIFTTPNMTYIDIQARKLFHTYIEAYYVDYRVDCVKAKYLEIQHNSRFDKTYYRRPTYEDENGKVHTIDKIYISKPSDSIIKAYEKVKGEYVQNNLLEAMKSVSALGEEKKPKEKVHTHQWYARMMSNDWRCKNCGETTSKNPF